MASPSPGPRSSTCTRSTSAARCSRRTITSSPASPDTLQGLRRTPACRAQEWSGDLVFLHEVKPGPADRSYGVQVAKLAGLPAAAVRRAEAVLKKLEAKEGGAKRLEELPLFASLHADRLSEERRSQSKPSKLLCRARPRHAHAQGSAGVGLPAQETNPSAVRHIDGENRHSHGEARLECVKAQRRSHRKSNKFNDPEG